MAQNRRLIDANAFWDELKFQHDRIMQDPVVAKGSKWREALCFDRVVRLLGKCPTVDAAEVRPGRWLTPVIGKYGCVCSVCKMQADNDYNYCPNCGAKMDLEEAK